MLSENASPLLISQGRWEADPPLPLISSASDLIFPSVRATQTTCAPASDKTRAITRPIPWEAPVTMATLSDKLNKDFF